MSRSNQTQFNNEPIRDQNHVMPYGKYKGISIADIIYADPNYLVWMHNNSDTFELHADLLDEIEEAAQTWKP